eukprot:jgi/Mesvir1/20444/Mv12339-RA.1
MAKPRAPGTPTVEPEAERLLNFWFGKPAERAQGNYRHRFELWFSDAYDDEFRDNFGDLWKQAARGELANWESTPDTALALIILLDQLSRNLKRGTPEMFANDATTLRIVGNMVAQGWHLKLTWPERIFLYMPLLHSERLEDQRRGVGLFEELAATAPGGQQAAFERHLYMARRHMEEIERFGRFPHRNMLLGRLSTANELAWLAASQMAYHKSCQAKGVAQPCADQGTAV